MKRKILSFLGIIVAMLSALALFVACGKMEDAGSEAGEYYCAAESGGEELLTLGVDGVKKFTLKIGGDELSGSYTVDGSTVSLVPKGGEAISALCRETDLSLQYKETTYLFLKKVDFTVKFVSDGSAVADAAVLNGKTAAEPTDPTKSGSVFIGWYTDSAYTDLYDFGTPVMGDLTLYGRFEAQLDPEYTVQLNANGGSVAVQTTETVGHKLYNLPDAVWEGHTFAGWWMSDFYQADEPTCRYEGQALEENMTLYALWESDAPAVSVTESGVKWDSKGNNVTYRVTITPPAGEPEEVSVSTTTYAYDFSEKEAGRYEVSVTWDGHTATAYYNNKRLAKVSAFRVTESTLQFFGVKNATGYTLEVSCGTAGHLHADTELDATKPLSYDFGSCLMGEEGITFVVTAHADGYLTSVSEIFTYKRTLEAVTGLSVDPAAEEATWDAVAGARYYKVKIKAGDTQTEQVVSADKRSVSLKGYAAGAIEIAVTPVAASWCSPAAASVSYRKASLGAPQNVRIENGSLKWDGVADAVSYEVLKDGNKVATVTETSWALTQVSGAASFAVRAVAADTSKNSVASEAVGVDTAVKSVVYSAGKAVWNYVLGAESYHVKVKNGETEKTYEVTSNEWKVAFIDSGTNTVSVWTGDDESAAVSVDVVAYCITFDAQYGHFVDENLETTRLFAAEGDPLALPGTDEVERSGYEFVGWFEQASRGGRLVDDPFCGGKDMTLFAAWEGNEYYVTFDVGDYSEETLERVKVKFGEPFTWAVPKSTDVTRTFRGWYFSAATLSMQFTDIYGKSVAAYSVPSDVTVHAAWVEIYDFKPLAEDVGYAVSKKPSSANYLTDITIPAVYNDKPVMVVEDFSGCPNLVTVNIPGTIDTISLAGVGVAFTSCFALQSVNIYTPEDHEYTDAAKYASEDGVLFYYNVGGGSRTELAYYPVAHPGAEYTIPAEVTFPDGVVRAVTTLPKGAFYTTEKSRSSLESLTVPGTVSLVEELAFYNFSKLTNITFEDGTGPNGATELDIRGDAFGNAAANTAPLTEITLPSHISNVTYDSFARLSALENVYVSPDNDIYSSIDGILVKNETQELIFFPKGKAVTTYRVPAEVTAIGEHAFEGITKITELVIPAHVTSIGESAFADCKNVEKVTFGGKTSSYDLSIGAKAFYGMNKLTELTLPANLISIGQYAFGGATKLAQVTIETDRANAEIADGAFLSTSSVGYVSTLIIGKMVPTFSISAVFGSGVKEIRADGNHNFVKEVSNGVWYNADRTELLFVPENITSFEIPDTITSIPDGTFEKRILLKSITIPASVTSIGAKAFYNCSGLTDIVFAEGEEELTIGEEAFYGCSGLKEIDLPDRLVSLGGRVLYNCSQIKTLNIPKNVRTIAGVSTSGSTFAFYAMRALTQITVDPENTCYRVKDGALYTLRAAQDGAGVKYVEDTMIFTPRGNSAKTITVPGTVTKVEAYALYQVNALNNLIFEDSVATTSPDGKTEGGTIEIAKSAIHTCYNLTTLDLPVGLTQIVGGFVTGASATKVHSLSIPNTVTTIDTSAFQYLTKVTEVIFESGNDTVGLNLGTSAASKIFTYMTDLTSISLPKRLVQIGKQAFTGLKKLETVTFAEGSTMFKHLYGEAFSGCTALTSIDLPASTEDIGDSAFKNCLSLQEISIPASVKQIGKSAFAATHLTSVEFKGDATAPSALTSIGDSCFDQCFALESVTFGTFKAGAEVTIGKEAFSDCRSLVEIVLPAEVTSLGNGAFTNCYRLGDVSFAVTDTVKSKLTSIGDSAFAYTALTGFEFPETEETLKLGVTLFTGCSLGTVKVSSKIENLNRVFNGSVPSVIVIDEKNTSLQAGSDGAKEIWELAEGKKGALQVVYGDLGSTLTIAEGTTVIEPYLYQGHVEITTVVLPASVVQISEYAFDGCTELSQITIPANSALVTIEDSAFNGCSSLTAIDFSNAHALTAIGANVFSGTSLKTIDLSGASRLTSLGSRLFYSLGELQKVNLPKSVNYLGTDTFYNCKKLVAVGTAATIDDLVENVFDFSQLPIVHIGSKQGAAATAAGNVNVFRGCEKIKEVKLPTSVTDIGAFAFYGCSALATISGLDNVTLLGNDCLYQTALEEFTFTSNMATLGTDLLKNNTKLKKVIFAADCPLTEIPQNAFASCSGLKEVDLSGASGLTSIANYAFQNCSKLDSFDVTKTPALEKIGNYAFASCTALETFDFTALPLLTTLGGSAFSKSGLTEVDLTGTMISDLGGSVFSNCNSLLSATMPESLTVFSGGTSGTFQACAKLQSVDMSACHLFIGFGTSTSVTCATFLDCSSLESIILPLQEICIGKQAFKNCTSLSEEGIDFSHVVGIASNAFENCGFVHLTLPSAVTGWIMDSKTIYGRNDGNGGTVAQEHFKGNKKLVELIIPETAKDINLGNSMFLDCTSLETISFPDGFTGLASMGDSTAAFENCTSLTSVDLSRTAVEFIPYYSFRGCTQLEEVKLPVTVTAINSGAFARTALKSVDWSDLVNLQKLGDGLNTVFSPSYTPAGVFESCKELVEVILPKTELFFNLGRWTFHECTALERVDLSGTGITALTQDNIGRENIGAYMKDVTNETTLDSHVFSNCTSLKEIILPEGLKQVAGYAFENCTSLTSFDFSNLTRIGISAFHNTGIENIVLNKDIELIVTETISSGKTTYRPSPFEATNAKSLTIAGEPDENGRVYNTNRTYFTQNNMLFAASEDDAAGATSRLVYVPAAEGSFEDGKLDLSGVSDLSLNQYFLQGIENITEVVLPETLKTIPDYAFYGSSVTKVTLPAELETIGASAFEGTGLTEISLPAGLGSIGDKAFSGVKLTEISLPAGLESIGASAFAGSDLATVAIPKSVTFIGAGAFSGCKKLTTVTFTDGGAQSMTWGDGTTSSVSSGGGTPGVFESTALADFTVPAGLKSIPIRAFANVAGPVAVATGSAVTSIGAYAFYKYGQASFEIPATVKRIGTYSFSESKLTSVTLPETLEAVGTYSFAKCTSLLSADIEGNYFNITASDVQDSTNKGYWFTGCSALQDVTIGDAVEHIWQYTFEKCVKLTEIDLNQVKEVFGYAFSGCSTLATVTMPNVRVIGTKAFDGCTKLGTVTIGKGIASIASGAFGASKTLALHFEGTRYEVINACGTGWLSDYDNITFADTESAAGAAE